MPDRLGQKIYVHVSGKTTILRQIPFEATVNDVCASWAALQRHPDLLGSVTASTLRGRTLQGCQVISRALGVNPEICLEVTPQQLDADDSHTSARGSQEPVGPKRASVAKSQSAPSGLHHAPETLENRASTSPLIAPLLERAADKEASQHFKSAAFIYDQVRAQSHSDMALSMCWKLHLFTPQASEGDTLPFAFHLIQPHMVMKSMHAWTWRMSQVVSGLFPPSMPMQILAIDHRHQETLLRYVRLLQRAKQPNRALKHSSRAVEAHPKVFEINLLHADCLRYSKQSIVSLKSIE